MSNKKKTIKSPNISIKNSANKKPSRSIINVKKKLKKTIASSAVVSKLTTSASRFKQKAKRISKNHSRRPAAALVLFVLAVFIFGSIMSQSASAAWVQNSWSGGVGTSSTNQYQSSNNISNNGSSISLTKSEQFTNGDMESGTTNWRTVEATGGQIHEYIADGTNGTAGQTYRVHTYKTTGVTSSFTINYAPSDVSVDYLIVAGGGAGGNGSSSNDGGGGGAGGFVEGTTTISSGSSVNITVGAGGTRSATTSGKGNNGANSTFSSFSATGGGAGGAGNALAGNTGGSGGGGGGGGAWGAGASGTSGQGSSGANGEAAGAYSGGGGGGASSAAGGGSLSTGVGKGGDGKTSSISGVASYYAGGGSGGYSSGTAGGNYLNSAGLGGGGRGIGGPFGGGINADDGWANTGGGGGGAGNYTNSYGGNGGSGIVVLRYAVTNSPFVSNQSIVASGGEISEYTGNGTNGTNGVLYRAHTFKYTGTSSFLVGYAPTGSTVEYLVVAGGGSGGGVGVNMGSAGGGGAGGVLKYVSSDASNNSQNPLSVAAGTYSVVVGGGGTAPGYVSQNGANGGNSSLGSLTAIGGGGGGSGSGGGGGTTRPGSSGGSGGGGGYSDTSPGAGGPGTAGPPIQGYNGGSGGSGSPYGAGGGGGAGAVGGSGHGKAGGIGVASYITGSNTTYGGGGGGGNQSSTPETNPAGGGGKGAYGITGGSFATAGTNGLGGGGGGGSNNSRIAANGGSGIVIIRYPVTSTQSATITSDTGVKYGSSTRSTKVVTTVGYGFSQNKTLQNGTSYKLEAYVYTNGGAVTSDDAELYVNGSAITTTYTSVGSGWYKLSATVNGTGSNSAYGVAIKQNRTAYIDDMSLFNYNTPGTLTSSVFNLGFGGKWGDLTLGTSGTGTVTAKVRSSNNQNMTGASDWSTCPDLTSGTSLAGKPCMTDNHRYIQYQLTLNSGDNGASTPSVTSVTINYDEYDSKPPSINASQIAMSKAKNGDNIASGAWTNGSTPYFTWDAGFDAETGIKGYCLYLGQDPTANVAQTKGILGESPIQSNVCQYIATSNELNTATNALSSQLTTSNTPYYLLIKAIDNADNVYSGDPANFNFKFDNTPPSNPAFISAPSQFIATKDVTMTWPTSQNQTANDSNSGLAGLQYRIGETGTWYGASHNGTQGLSDLLPNNGSYTTNATFDFPNIQEGNNVVYFRAVDNAGNFATNYATAVIRLNTSAPSTPQNLTANPKTNTSNSFAFSWDPPATFAGSSASTLTYCYTINRTPTANNCNFTGAGQTSLSADAYATQPGENTIYVVAKDEAGNINYSTTASTTFTANTAAPGLPIDLDVTDISNKATQNWRLALSWTAPQDAGAGVSKYQVLRSTDGTNFGQIGDTAGLSYVDSGLSQQTYYYKVKACDSANNCSALSDTVSKLPTGRFTSPANLISSPSVNVGTRKGTITWTTDRESDTKIQFGKSSGNYFTTESSNSDQVKVHSLDLINLEAGTTYFFRTKWTDEDGNTGISPEYSFTTLPAPSIKNVEVTDVGLTTATIAFTAVDATQVNIRYGKTEAFGGAEVINTSSSESKYVVQLRGLNDGTKYFYTFDTLDRDGNSYQTGIVLTFETPPRPSISNLRFQPIEGEPTSTQKITWETNIPTTSQLTYGKIGSGGSEVTSSGLKTSHETIIRNLEDDSTYFVIAQGRDSNGNLASSDRQVFRTALDTRVPKISDISVEATTKGTGPEARGQIIVSWKTDEPATSQVAYAEGSDVKEFNNKSAIDGALTTEHIVIVSDLPTSKLFSVQPLSKDKAGNEAKGEVQSAIIGKPSDNVLTIILGTLEKIFGF